MMAALFSLRVWIALALALALAASHWKSYVMGKATIRAEWNVAITAQALATLKASETARAKEAELQTKVTKVANDYQLEKKRRAADAVIGAGRLRDLTAALAGAAAANPATTSGADEDPRLDIIAECAGAAVKLDKAVKELASETSALQSYAREVCVAK